MSKTTNLKIPVKITKQPILVPKNIPNISSEGTNNITNTSRKCKSCLKEKDLEEFDKIGKEKEGKKTYRKTSCIECLSGKTEVIKPSVKNNPINVEHNSLINNKLEEYMTKFTTISETSISLNDKVSEIYNGIDKISKMMSEEEIRRRNKELELHNKINEMANNMTVLMTFIERDKKQTVDLVTTIDNKFDKLYETYERNHKDIQDFIEDVENNHKQILIKISNGEKPIELLKEQTALITTVKNEMNNSNEVFLERQAKVESNLSNMKIALENNMKIMTQSVKERDVKEKEDRIKSTSRSPNRTIERNAIISKRSRSPDLTSASIKSNESDYEDFSESERSDQSLSGYITPEIGNDLEDNTGRLTSIYTKSIIPIDEIKSWDDEKLDKAKRAAASAASNYKTKKNMKDVYKIARTNTDNLRKEVSDRKGK